MDYYIATLFVCFKSFVDIDTKFYEFEFFFDNFEF